MKVREQGEPSELRNKLQARGLGYHNRCDMATGCWSDVITVTDCLDAEKDYDPLRGLRGVRSP